MNPTAMLIAALVVLPAVGLVTWARLTMAQVEEDLRSFSGIEEMSLQRPSRTM